MKKRSPERLRPGRSDAAYPTHAEVATDRRGFLKSLGALALATGVGACADEWGTSGIRDAGSRDVGLMDRFYPTEGDLPIDGWRPAEPDGGSDAVPGDAEPADGGTDAAPSDAEPGDGGTDTIVADAEPTGDSAATDDASAQNVHR